MCFIYILFSVTIMGKKKGGLYEWFVKIGEMQHDMIDFLLFLAVFLVWIDPIDRPSAHKTIVHNV